MNNIVVLVSGSGTNLQALIDAEKAGRFSPKAADTGAGKDGAAGGHICAVLSDRRGAYALERAAAAGIKTCVETPRRDLAGDARRAELSARILAALENEKADLVVLAGFLSILCGDIIKKYQGKIINLHPSLLPNFGGGGMYGRRVHEAVLASGERESGCTVHFVDSGTDTGPILLQRRVPVLPGDTPDTLAARIHAEEHSAIVEAVALLVTA